jgi:hypothetical protein
MESALLISLAFHGHCGQIPPLFEASRMNALLYRFLGQPLRFSDWKPSQITVSNGGLAGLLLKYEPAINRV